MEEVKWEEDALEELTEAHLELAEEKEKDSEVDLEDN